MPSVQPQSVFMIWRKALFGKGCKSTFQVLQVDADRNLRRMGQRRVYSLCHTYKSLMADHSRSISGAEWSSQWMQELLEDLGSDCIASSNYVLGACLFDISMIRTVCWTLSRERTRKALAVCQARLWSHSSTNKIYWCMNARLKKILAFVWKVWDTLWHGKHVVRVVLDRLLLWMAMDRSVAPKFQFLFKKDLRLRIYWICRGPWFTSISRYWVVTGYILMSRCSGEDCWAQHVHCAREIFLGRLYPHPCQHGQVYAVSSGHVSLLLRGRWSCSAGVHFLKLSRSAVEPHLPCSNILRQCKHIPKFWLCMKPKSDNALTSAQGGYHILKATLRWEQPSAELTFRRHWLSQPITRLLSCTFGALADSYNRRFQAFRYLLVCTVTHSKWLTSKTKISVQSSEALQEGWPHQ